MALPFDTAFYDTLYLSISSVLREKFPQGAEEDLLSWHRRLLYEFVSYLQATYEPDTTAVKVQANKKNNKKKNTPGQTNFTVVDTTLFNTNIEQALDIVSQDSNFATYLMAWWLPIIISPTDTVTICLDLDCSSTLAASVKLTRLEMEFSWWSFRVLSINNIALGQLAPKTNDAQTLEDCAGDPFVRGILHALYKSANGGEKPPASLTIADVRESATISLNSAVDPFANAAQIATILWKLKNIVEPLFIAGLTLKSNLITEDLMVSKASEDKSQRKRFNSRKFIETATPAEMSAGVLQTLAISTFRTFYDFDADTIDPQLFDYLFLNKHSLTLE